MKKKIILLFATFISLSTLIACLLSLFNNKASNFINAKNESYKIVMNSETNKLHNNSGLTPYSGESTIKTNLNNDISFSYTDLLGLSSTWHVAKSGGSFYNVTPIHGLESISLSFKTDDKEFKLYWSSTTSFIEDDSQIFTSSSTSSTIFDFKNDYPSHFKFVNTSGSNLNISDVELTYSCQNNYPTLSISSENETMGTVSGSSGIVCYGDSVSITATPTGPGYKFVGWYSGSSLVSSDATYNFVMGRDDLNYVAHFMYQAYNFVVQSEDSKKGSIVNDVSGSYDYLTPITIEAAPSEGYSFAYWSNGYTYVSLDNPYTFNMPFMDTTYTAVFSANPYDLTLINNDSSLGDITGGGTFYFCGSSVTIVATPKTGVSFLGWFDTDDNLVSSLSTYTFDMPAHALTYVAKFALTPYAVQITVNDSNMGSVSGAGSYVYQQEVTLVATPNEHHSFFGWYDGETLLSKELTYVFEMPANSLNYQARFVQNHNLFIYSDDESKGTVSFPSEWGEGLEVTITANAEIGYALDYWCDDDFNEVSYDASYTFVMPNTDVTLYASFVAGRLLTVTSNDTTRGTVSGGGAYPIGRTVEISLNHLSGIFKGWFDENDQFVTYDNPYSFVMPSVDYSLEARFMTESEEIEWDNSHGVTPTISDDGGTITYGLYPQTNVNDPSLISSLNTLNKPESNGWYHFNDEYYAKVIATPANSYTYFDNGTKIVSGTTYWFKCEPIMWKVLQNNNGDYLVVSTVLLDAYYFFHVSTLIRTIDDQTVYPNNYKYSDIRDWLNLDFYNSAFTLGNNCIQTTHVINANPSNEYACEDTFDKVFLLSSREYSNNSYGFSNSPRSSRYCKTTDWARARGSFSDSRNDDAKYNGCYWTRSPDNATNYEAWYIDSIGEIQTKYVTNASYSVRPAITLSLN